MAKCLERKKKKDRFLEAIEADNKDAIPVIYIGDKKVQYPVLSPDGRHVTLRLVTESKDSEQTIVPDYVTETGFTMELNTRPKVGYPQDYFEFAFVALEKDSLITSIQPAYPELMI